jgi:hypothetical protein
MTNHPRRKHDEENEPSIEDMVAEAVEPLAAEMREKLGIPQPGEVPPQGSAEVPAHTGNGVPAGLKANAAKQIGDAAGAAMAGALGNLLPQMLVDAFANVLMQVPVQLAGQQQRLCATCLVQRIGWENLNRAEMEKAMDAAAQAAGVQPGTPQAAQLDFLPFLAPHLRPGERNGMPGVSPAVTTFQGTDSCPMHIPGVQAGRTPLLVATAGMSPAMAAQFAGR